MQRFFDKYKHDVGTLPVLVAIKRLVDMQAQSDAVVVWNGVSLHN